MGNQEKIKYLLGIIIAVLLSHDCAVESQDTNKSIVVNSGLPFQNNSVVEPTTISTAASMFEYETEIDMSVLDLNSVLGNLQFIVSYVTLPVTVGYFQITDIDLTTVCGLNGTEYECQCEADHVWSSDTCTANHVCDRIVGGTCGCIEALPSQGPLCQRASSIPTPSPPLEPRVLGMSVKINQNFETSLADPNSQSFKDLSGKIESSINLGYSDHLSGYVDGSAKVIAFRSGSIIVDYTINATSASNSLNFVVADTNVSNSLMAQGINVTENDFSQSEQSVFIKDHMYPLQQLTLTCTQPSFAQGQIKWMVNDKDPAQDMTTYSLSNNNSTLIVKNASESDSGQYSCIIETNTIPYIQWQNIVITQRPSIIVGDKERVFPCDYSKSVLLTCTVDSGYSIEWVMDESVQNLVQINDLGSDGITLNYTSQSGNCTEEIFTCRLKNLPQLQNYSYSQSSVTVTKMQQPYNCINEELGIGNTSDIKNGTCGAGMKGTVTYICASNQIWTLLQNNCVLEIINTLKNIVETLSVGDIPQFMAILSSAAIQNNINITQSPATVQAIVDILFKIANLSQTTLIDQHVMGDFLTTVDIIVSSNVSETWSTLNKGNSTNNTNIKLLSAIESISDRLQDEFSLTEKSIQLNRTAVNNSFIITSTLPNSTTEIVFPHVLQATTITIIIFTTLDKILPTRDTSNNSSGNTDVHINGDVVVVKVNELINNISFAFDINNQSLGNPQCVFWNFSLDAWDSTGCEVKTINTGNETGKITCECNHTTSFSILMSPFSIDSIALAYITYIGVGISMASLIVCLIIEAIIWKSVRRNDTSYMRHVSIVNIAFSLLIADICFIIGASIGNEGQPTPVGPCSAAVFFMHFFYLALFFWMLVSALFLLYRTVMVLSQMSMASMMVIAFTVGYGAPLLIAVITVASTAGPQNYVSKSDSCWLNWTQSKALLAFVIPALTIVAINLVVLVVVLYKMLRRGVGATTQPDEKHTLVVIARCVAILTPIFGLTWGLGIGTMVSADLGIQVVFALLNSLQGFFILVFGTLIDNKVREALPGKLSIQSLISSQTRSTSAGLSPTSGLNLFQNRRRRNVYNISEPNHSPVTSSDGHYSYSTNT